MYQIKQKNKNTLKALKFIYKCVSFSIPDLGKFGKITYPTAKRIVDDLLKEDIIIRTGNKISTGGRGQEEFKINYSRYYSIGIKVETGELSFVLVNISGQIVKEKFLLNLKITRNNLLSLLTDEFSTFLEGLSAEYKDNLLGVGISFPGIVSKEKATIINGVNFNIRDLDLSPLFDSYDFDFFIENEANCEIYSERLFSYGRDLDNFLVVSIGSGVGGGIYLDSKIYLGMSGTAGEIGHTVLYPGGNPCLCGSRGCLETYLSVGALKESLGGISGREGFKRYNEDEKIKNIIDRYVDDLSLGIRNILFPINIDNVIITGKLAPSLKGFKETILEKIKDNIFYKDKDISIYFSKLESNSDLVGAAMIPISKFFNLL